MRSQWIERLVAAVALLGVGCQDRGTDETPTALVKLTPASVRADGVATEDVWRLFDRSTSSSIAPAAGTSIVVDLGGQVDVAALKVHGPAPYTLEVDGFGATDLSQLAAGWHVLLPESPVDAARLSLALTPTGGTGALSEIEVWAAADSATAPATVSATAAPPPRAAVARSDLRRLHRLARRPSRAPPPRLPGLLHGRHLPLLRREALDQRRRRAGRRLACA